MPKLSNMLKKEAQRIATNEQVGKRTDCTDLLVSARFGSDHIHHILPAQGITDNIVDDLLAYTSEDFNKNLKGGESPVVTETEDKAPKEVIFHNRQAFGDILTMTCAVRDFKDTFPNTRIGVHTTAMHIWDHNPHIDHTFRMGSLSANKATVKIGPGFLTNKSGLWDYHMANAFRMDIQNKMNLKINQGPIRPDIWFTEEEFHRTPVIDIDKPYWVFIYGGEPGWPSKQYHRWQEVIDILKDDIQFVQLGVEGHPYPRLKNVIDYVGKTQDRNTGIRDLFNIFLHAQGSLGLVSMHMHLSAAFNNPCVVLAGAREPASFTQYWGHHYVHTNGTLDCSETKACWACKLEGCRTLVSPTNPPTEGHNTPNQVPKCVDIIEPEEIAEGVRKYYKGGRLTYGEKKPNTFFKNVVREKKLFSVPKPEKVDNDLLKKFGFEWGGGSITDRDWLFLMDIFKTYNVKTILEFGVGLSSLLFATKVDKVMSFETMPGWINKIKEMADENKNEILHWDGKHVNPDVLKKHDFDFAFVDGPAGGQAREHSTRIASEQADLIVVHDAGRVWERKWQEKYLAQDYDLVSKGGHRCHFWAKKEICKVKEKERQAEVRAQIESDERPSFRMITTCRGFGGSERSSLFIMQDMLNRGYRVELISTGNISGEYRKNIPSDVIVRPWNDMPEPVDLITFYTSDTIWNYNKPQYLDVMDKLNCKRKVMILNYQLGGAGEVTWTHNWDLYMFLNSTKEGELLERLNSAKTKVLPPPTDLDPFFKVDIDYPNRDKGNIKLIRHNSQRDAKHPEYTNELITQILDEVNDNIEFFYMPPRSTTFDHPNIHKFKVNQIPVPQFLSQGNCFWYHLPPGYQDQGPRVIIEAMACGLPCIGDNSYGAKDRITEDTGWLCEDVSDYIEVIKEINDDIAILKEKGRKARHRARTEFVPTRWADCIIGE